MATTTTRTTPGIMAFETPVIAYIKQRMKPLGTEAKRNQMWASFWARNEHLDFSGLSPKRASSTTRTGATKRASSGMTKRATSTRKAASGGMQTLKGKPRTAAARSRKNPVLAQAGKKGGQTRAKNYAKRRAAAGGNATAQATLPAQASHGNAAD